MTTWRSGLRAARLQSDYALAVRVDDVPHLRRAFERPEHWAEHSIGVHAARAQALLREHVVSRLDAALSREQLRAVLVKGEALARTVYPQPWMRCMSDIDLLVPDADLLAVNAVLTEGGFERVADPAGRTRSFGAVNETAYTLAVGQGAFTVEVHAGLDKLVRRNVDVAAIVARADQLGDALFVPATEDQFLLVVLHAAASDFDHVVGWLDLHLLLGAPLDLDQLMRRAEAWDLRTALYVAMMSLRAAGSQRVPERLIAGNRPSWLRRRLLAQWFDAEQFPMRPGARADGLAWAARQLPLRDDTWRWLAGCGRYGVLRVLDRLAKAPRSSTIS